MRTTEPVYITQGEQIAWKRTFGGYPSDEWTLQYRFRGPGPGFNITGVASGSGFEATATTTQTAAMESGQYVWQAWLTSIATPTDIREVDAGSVTVKVGFTASPTTEIDLRSPAKIMLDTIDDALLAFATSDVMEYEISTPAGSRRVKRSDKMNLKEQRNYWATIVARENAAERLRNGGKYGLQVKVRMRST